jgi:hypothetical protein
MLLTILLLLEVVLRLVLVLAAEALAVFLWEQHQPLFPAQPIQ